jgi:hypothetical protein
MNIIETIGAIAAGIITVAIVAIIVQPGSTAAALVTSSGTAFSSSIKSATLRG